MSEEEGKSFLPKLIPISYIIHASLSSSSSFSPSQFVSLQQPAAEIVTQPKVKPTSRYRRSYLSWWSGSGGRVCWEVNCWKLNSLPLLMTSDQASK